MRTKLVIGNWKMNGSSSFVSQMADQLNSSSVQLGSGVKPVVCPPSPYLMQIQSLLEGSGVEVGAQNLSDLAEGAYTGEISSTMLADVGCKWVLVGHSERRTLFGETSEWVAQKAQTALRAGLNTVVCIGETIEQRRAGETEDCLKKQLKPVLELESIGDFGNQLVIAYEPVWAIGTGEAATSEQAQEVHAFIRELLGDALTDIPILYGGSVTPDNAASLFAQQDIDGALVGGASLVAEKFINICQAMPSS